MPVVLQRSWQAEDPCLDGGQYCRYVVDGTPLILKNVQTDASVGVDCVWVVQRVSGGNIRLSQHAILKTFALLQHGSSPRLTVWVIHLGHKLDDWRLVRVVFGESECQQEDTWARVANYIRGQGRGRLV